MFCACLNNNMSGTIKLDERDTEKNNKILIVGIDSTSLNGNYLDWLLVVNRFIIHAGFILN